MIRANRYRTPGFSLLPRRFSSLRKLGNGTVTRQPFACIQTAHISFYFPIQSAALRCYFFSLQVELTHRLKMLTGSKTTFKVRQMPPDIKVRSPRSVWLTDASFGE